MKHLLNNLTEQEKNSIREQHTGGMEVVTKNFSRLMNGKRGDSKPLVSEQEPTTDQNRYNTAGYKEVTDINLPDGTYIGNPDGYSKDASDKNLNYVSDLHIYDKSNKKTGYVICLRNPSRSGEYNANVVITNKKSNFEGEYYFKEVGYKPSEISGQNVKQEKPIKTIKTKELIYLPQEIIDAPAPKTNIVNGKGSFKLKNGNLYAYDFSDVTNLTQENTYFLSETSKNNVYKIPDMMFANTNSGENISVWVGFTQSTTPGNTGTIIYQKRDENKKTNYYVAIQATS